MNNPFYRIALLFPIALILGGIGNRGYAIDFRSDQLEEIAGNIPVVWPENDTSFTVRHNERDVLVRVADKMVQHIGYKIFPEAYRQLIVDPIIADFVERYLLNISLPLRRQKSVARQMKEDRFVFQAGDPQSLYCICQDSSICFSCTSTDHDITMTWGRTDDPLCRISFPKDHELILGRRMIENDTRLPREISSVRAVEPKREDGEMSLLTTSDTVTSIRLAHTGSYLTRYLRSDRYYAPDSVTGKYHPIFEIDHPQESIANLLTDSDIEKANNIKLSIRHKIYGLKEQIIETTISQFVAYCRQNGCLPFVGILALDEEVSGSADVLVLMRNWQVGYLHVLRLSLPLESISTGYGHATARLNAFVPISNIKNLFKN